MDSKTYTKDLRKACVEAVFDELAEHGDMIRPQYAEQWALSHKYRRTVAR